MKKKKYYFLLILTLSVLMIWCNAYASTLAGDKVQGKTEIMKKAFGMRLPFIANEGQINEDVSFYAKTFGGTLYVTGKGEMVYSLPRISKVKATDAVKKGTEDKKAWDKKIDVWILKENLLGAYKIYPKGMDKAKTQVSYFKGNDKKKWKSNISTYNGLSLGRVYDGIDLFLKAYGKNVEKIFTVYPAGKVNDIRVKIDGASSLKSNLNGELEIQTDLGPVRFSAPLAYQMIDGKRKTVNAAYDVKGNTYGFRVVEYDRRYPLIIDPLLASTFIGGALTDEPYAAVLDSANNVYMTGFTESTDFPTTSGAYSGTLVDWGYDVFVAKLSSDFTSLLAATYIGGSGSNEYGNSIALDSENKVYITGSTDSDDPDDFPTTPGAYDTNHNGRDDAFVCKFSNNLSSLQASTFIGGSGSDTAYSIAIDNSDKVYISGYASSSSSSDFPTTTGAYDRVHNGGADVFVAKFNNMLGVLEASTFVGGGANEHGFAIAVDSSSDVWVSGWTNSSNFPVTSGAFDEEYNGGQDAFVSRLNSNLTDLEAATYIGGSADEKANDIKVAPSGTIYITGWTDSTDFPTTSPAYDESANGEKDVFVSRLNSDLTALSASTYLGGTINDEANELTFDQSGNVYLTGYTYSSDFPTTPGAYDRTLNEGWTGGDVFVAKLNSSLTLLPASTFLGGIDYDEGAAVALDGVNNVYIVGLTDSDDFPVTSGAYDQTSHGYLDLFVSKLDENLSAGATPPVVTSTTPATEATDVAVDASIYARFSTAMDPATITTSTFLINDGAANIIGIVLYEGKTARFVPVQDLDYSHIYTVHITTGVTDLGGTPMADEYTWTFQTFVLGNNPPDKPTLVSPADGATDVSLTTELQTGTFSDPDSGNTHLQTRWQISTVSDFSSLILDVTNTSHLTTLIVPESVLNEGITYYWRAMFYDNHESASVWADAYSFTTLTTSNDTNPENGVPDDQEVDDTVDLDENSEADLNQSDIKCVDTVVGDGQIGVKVSTNVTSVESLKSIDPASISDTTNKPDEMPLGLISFKIVVSNPGDTAEVTVYLSEAAGSNAEWYKYDSINGWQDYSAHATFSADRKSVTLELKDGDYGDADGTANGIIVDPSGPVYSSSGSTTTTGGSSSGCFIATAAYGSYMESHVLVLRDFRDRFLLNNTVGKAFVRLYYACSPPVADFIAGHDSLRAVVRIGLMPVVGISHVALHTTTVQRIMLILFVFGFILAAFMIIKGFKRRETLI